MSTVQPLTEPSESLSEDEARAFVARTVNFLLIGAQKSGTTWLYQALSQHEDIFVPETKEPHFFDRNATYEKGYAWYADHFAPSQNQTAIGECTPNYLWAVGAPSETTNHPEISKEIPERIQAVLPDAKFIVLLRNPVKTGHFRLHAFSHTQPDSAERQAKRRTRNLGRCFFRKIRPSTEAMV